MATLHEESSLKLHLGAHLLKSSCGDLWRETVKPFSTSGQRIFWEVQNNSLSFSRSENISHEGSN